jgi:hypothetical protein
MILKGDADTPAPRLAPLGVGHGAKSPDTASVARAHEVSLSHRLGGVKKRASNLIKGDQRVWDSQRKGDLWGQGVNKEIEAVKERPPGLAHGTGHPLKESFRLVGARRG